MSSGWSLYVIAIVALEARPFFWHVLGDAGVLEPHTVDPRPYWFAIVGLSALLALATLAWGCHRIDRQET